MMETIWGLSKNGSTFEEARLDLILVHKALKIQTKADSKQYL